MMGAGAAAAPASGVSPWGPAGPGWPSGPLQARAASRATRTAPLHVRSTLLHGMAVARMGSSGIFQVTLARNVPPIFDYRFELLLVVGKKRGRKTCGAAGPMTQKDESPFRAASAPRSRIVSADCSLEANAPARGRPCRLRRAREDRRHELFSAPAALL